MYYIYKKDISICRQDIIIGDFIYISADLLALVHRDDILLIVNVHIFSFFLP